MTSYSNHRGERLFAACHSRLHLAGGLLRQNVNVGETMRETLREFPVALNQWFLATLPLLEEVGPVRPFSRIGRCHPVVDRRRHEPNRLCGFGLLPQYQQHFRRPSLPRRGETLDLIQGNAVQPKVIDQRGYIARLLADDLHRAVPQDAGAMFLRSLGRPDKILQRLRNSPDTRAPLTRRPEKLHYAVSQDR